MRDDRSNKVRAVYFAAITVAAIMALSVVAMSVTFVGGVAAADIQDEPGTIPDDQERTSAENLTINSGHTILDGVPQNGNALSDSPLYNANLTGQHFGYVGLPTQEPEYDNSSLNYQQSRGGQVGTNPSQTIDISFNIVAPEDESIDTEEVVIDYGSAGDLGMQINQSATDNLMDQINDEVPDDGYLDVDGDENEIVNAEIDNAADEIRIEYEPTENASVTDLELSVVWEPEDPVEGIDIEDGSMTTISHILRAPQGTEDDDYRVAEAGATGITPGDTDAGGDVIDPSASPNNAAGSLELSSSDNEGSPVTSTTAHSFEVWAQQGQNITFLPNGADSRVQIYDVSTYEDQDQVYYELGSQVTSQTPAPGQAVTWNVDELGLESGEQYFVRFPDDTGNNQVAVLDVNELDLTADAEGPQLIDEEITINVSSETNSDDIEAYAWEADSFDDPDSEIGKIIDVETDTTDGTGASTIRLDAESDLDADHGDSFVVAVQHANSGVITATDEITVTDASSPTAEFPVEITETNAPVTKGETLTVRANVTNTGNAEATQTITLTDTGFNDTRRDATDVTLAPGGSNDSVALEWATSDGDAGSGTVTVASDISSDSAHIEISEGADGGVDIDENVIVEQRGDIAAIPVSMDSTETATVTLGTLDNNYQVNVTVEDSDDDGEAVVQFNTYAAGSEVDSTVFETADDGDSVLDVDRNEQGWSSPHPDEGILSVADYDILVIDGTDPAVSGGEDDNATLSLRGRATEANTVWTTHDDADVSDVEAIRNRIDDGTLTETSTVASEDLVVHELDVSGIGGPIRTELADRESRNATDAFLNLTASHTEAATSGVASNPNAAWDLWLNQTNAGANRADTLLDINHTTVDVIPDYGNDTYYVVYDPGATSEVSDSDEFETAFTVLDSTDLASNDQSVTAHWEYEAASAGLDDGQVDVRPTPNQTFTGTTNTAPGTELTVLVRGSDEASPFVEPLDTRVDEDGSFTATGDFSEYEPGTNYTVEVRRVHTLTPTYEGSFRGFVDFETTITDTNSPVTEGETLSVTASVANVGVLDGTQSVTLEAFDRTEVGNQSVALDANNETNVTLEWTTSESDADSGFLTVRTANDTATRSVTIEVENETRNGTTHDETPSQTSEDASPADRSTTSQNDTATQTDSTARGEGPGFGVIIAIVAVAGIALLGTRER